MVRLNLSSYTGCFLRPDIKRFCLTFTIGPDRIWFCLIPVSDFFLQYFLEFGQRFDLIHIYDVIERISNHNIVLLMQFYSKIPFESLKSEVN